MGYQPCLQLHVSQPLESLMNPNSQYNAHITSGHFGCGKGHVRTSQWHEDASSWSRTHLPVGPAIEPSKQVWGAIAITGCPLQSLKGQSASMYGGNKKKRKRMLQTKSNPLSNTASLAGTIWYHCKFVCYFCRSTCGGTLHSNIPHIDRNWCILQEEGLSKDRRSMPRPECRQHRLAPTTRFGQVPCPRHLPQ
jgi:hypothetical protein